MQRLFQVPTAWCSCLFHHSARVRSLACNSILLTSQHNVVAWSGRQVHGGVAGEEDRPCVGSSQTPSAEASESSLTVAQGLRGPPRSLDLHARDHRLDVTSSSGVG